MKVLTSATLSPVGVEILKKAGLEVDARSKTSVEEIEKIIGEYDALNIRSATVTPEVISAATNLKLIGRAGVGVDNVDVEAATQRGIVVMNTPAGNTISTAELTFSMLLALARKLPQAHGSMKAGGMMLKVTAIRFPTGHWVNQLGLTGNCGRKFH